MNRTPLFLLIAAVGLIGLCGCRQDMQDQPKLLPLRHSSFFSDGRSSRQQIVGTVARSQRTENDYFSTGLLNGGEGDFLPFPLTRAVMSRGQEQFNIYCAPCHSRTGNGKGRIVERGYHTAANFHTERLQDAPLGHFFTVITRGYGTMPEYSAEVAPADRWAIAAYIRALQLSQHAAPSDVPKGTRPQTLQALLRNSGFAETFLASWETPDTRTGGVAIQVPLTTASHLTHAEEPVANPKKPEPAVASETVLISGKPAKIAEGSAHKGNPAQGKLLYAADCSLCHQPTRTGIPPQIPSLLGTVDRLGEKKVRDVAKFGLPTGVPPMPPHPELSEADLDNLTAFLKEK